MRMGAAGGHRVESAGVPGMAARNAPHAEPGAAQQAEAADSLNGVAGARGMESAAGPEEWADGPLITADQPDREQTGGAAHSGPRLSITFFHSPARLACS